MTSGASQLMRMPPRIARRPDAAPSVLLALLLLGLRLLLLVDRSPSECLDLVGSLRGLVGVLLRDELDVRVERVHRLVVLVVEPVHVTEVPPRLRLVGRERNAALVRADR